MATKTNQVVLSFDKLTASDLKPLLKKFEKHQCPVKEVDAPNKSKRESGFLTKSFTLKFEDGQQVEVRVKADGTVFQVKLNKKPVPIKHVDNLDQAIVEIVDYVQDNAKAYERAKIQREKRKLQPKKPSITTSRREKIEKAQSELDELLGNNGQLNNQLVEIQTNLAKKRKELEQATNDLKREQEITVELQTEIASLQQAQ